MKMPHQGALAAVTLSLCAGIALPILSSSAAQRPGSPQHGGPGGRPAPHGTPAARPTSSGTLAAHPTPVAGGHDIALLEGALGRVLTVDEIAAMTLAATTRGTTVQAAQQAFVEQVAAIFGLTADGLKAQLKSRGKGGKGLVGVLQHALGRVLTDAEKAALQVAVTTRDTSVKAALDAYRANVAAAVGLSLADLDAKVQAYLALHGGHVGGPCVPGAKPTAVPSATATPTATATPIPDGTYN